MTGHLRLACAAFAACATATTLAACGSGSKDEAASASASKPVSSAALKTRLAEDYKGTFKALPADGPKGVSGKSVAIIPLTQLSPTMSDFTREAVAAAKALGWKPFVIDGKLSTQGSNEAIRQAISQRPDAIVLAAVNCPTVKEPVLAAKKAGIKVYSVYGVDCSPSLWDGYQPVDREGAARMRADWIASRLGGSRKVIALYLPEDPTTVVLQDETEAELKKVCPRCSVARVNWVLGDLGDPLKA